MFSLELLSVAALSRRQISGLVQQQAGRQEYTPELSSVSLKAVWISSSPVLVEGEGAAVLDERDMAGLSVRSL